tara:strand:+ start:392 stop:652 length:261 start_codon:yes stop_codon:yes gene_type:complete
MNIVRNPSNIRLTPAKRNILAHMKYRDQKICVSTAPGVNLAWLPDYPGIVRIESVASMISNGLLIRDSREDGIARYKLSATADRRI